MPLVIVSVREELFPETYCWALQECMRQALRAAGWSSEPWVQKVWVEFRAAVEARLRSKEPDLVLSFDELPVENLYYSRKPWSEG